MKPVKLEELTALDIDRWVIYQSDNPDQKPEDGRIVGWNDTFVFVCYDWTGRGKATRAENLRFGANRPKLPLETHPIREEILLKQLSYLVDAGHVRIWNPDYVGWYEEIKTIAGAIVDVEPAKKDEWK